MLRDVRKASAEGDFLVVADVGERAGDGGRGEGKGRGGSGGKQGVTPTRSGRQWEAS